MVAKKEYLNEPSWRHIDRKEPLPLEDWSNRQGNKKAFCEHCRTYKPRNARPKVKGWCCTDCINLNARHYDTNYTPTIIDELKETT